MLGIFLKRVSSINFGINPGKRRGFFREMEWSMVGSHRCPVLTVTNSHAGFTFYCRILTFMTTT